MLLIEKLFRNAKNVGVAERPLRSPSTRRDLWSPLTFPYLLTLWLLVGCAPSPPAPILAPPPVATEILAPTTSVRTETAVYITSDYTFRYPTVYQTAEQCQPRSAEEAIIELGQRTRVIVKEAQPLEQAMADFRALLDDTSEEQPLYRTDNGQIRTDEDGTQRATIEYRFGGTQRYGSVTFISDGNKLLEVHYTAGASCDFPEQNIFEAEVALEIGDTLTIK